jgi:hypothetical protein
MWRKEYLAFKDLTPSTRGTNLKGRDRQENAREQIGALERDFGYPKEF